MRSARFAFAATALFVAFTLTLRAAESGITSEARADFEWFSTLGFPDVKGKPFVRFNTGGSFQSIEEAQREHFWYGFLVSSNRNGATVLDSSLSPYTFTNFPARPPKRVEDVYGPTNNRMTNAYTFYFQPSEMAKLDLGQTIRDFLTEQEKIPSNVVNYTAINRLHEHFSAPWLETRSAFFLISWECWRQGLTNEAQRMYDVAEKIGGLPRNEDGKEPFRRRLTKDFSAWQLINAAERFGNTNLTRKELLPPFQAVVKNYPGTESAARAQEFVDRLGKMIAEDEQHAKSRRKPFAQMTTNERVAELIFELRDQRAEWGDERQAYVGATFMTNSPLAQLVRIGYPAVPQLIAALDDPSLTRAADPVEYATVVTVGDCTLAALDQIAHRQFYPRKTTRSRLSLDGDVAQVRRDVQAWWNDLQANGERATLIKYVSAGGDAYDQARELWAKYPDAAADAVIKGVLASPKYWQRSAMLETLRNTNTPAVNEFLEKEMHEAPDEDTRIAAAALLRERGQADAVDLMIRVWSDHTARFNTSLAWELVKSGSPKAIEALMKDIGSRSIESRWGLMETVSGAGNSTAPGVAEAVEKALVSMLDDEDQTVGSYFWGGKIGGYNAPRICDRAGMLLNGLWPRRYEFDLLATPKVRDQQLLACKNVWRKANNLPPLPSPDLNLKKVPPAEANNVVTVEWAANGMKPDTNFTALIDALQGRRLEGSNLVEIMTNYIRHLAMSNFGMDMTVRRDEDLTGVRVHIGIVPVSPAGHWGSWQRRVSLKIGSKELLGGYLAMALETTRNASEWTAVGKAVDQAVGTPSETPFYLHIKTFTSQPEPADPGYEHLAGSPW